MSPAEVPLDWRAGERAGSDTQTQLGQLSHGGAQNLELGQSKDFFPSAGPACLWGPIPHDPQTDVFPSSPDPHFPTSPLQAPSWLWFNHSTVFAAHVVSPCCPIAFRGFSASLHVLKVVPCSPPVSLSPQVSSWLMLIHGTTWTGPLASCVH